MPKPCKKPGNVLFLFIYSDTCLERGENGGYLSKLIIKNLK